MPLFLSHARGRRKANNRNKFTAMAERCHAADEIVRHAEVKPLAPVISQSPMIAIGAALSGRGVSWIRRGRGLSVNLRREFR